MSLLGEEAALRELPYYKLILKSFLKRQIGALLEELATETGEESIIIMADSSSRTASCLASNKAKSFFKGHEDVKNEFLSYCLSGFPSEEIRTPKTAKRKAKNGKKGGNSSKQPKLTDFSCISAPNSSRTESGRLDSSQLESGQEGNKDSSVAVDKISETAQSRCDTNNLGLFTDFPEDENSDKVEVNPTSNNLFDDTIKVKKEPLSDTDTVDEASNISIIKTEANIEECSQVSQQSHSMESLDMSITQSEQSFDMSYNQPIPGATQTIGPIRYVRKFPPKERTTLSLPEKIQIIQEFEMGGEATSQRKLADKYNISKSAVADMLKNRQLLKEHYEFNANTKRKRFNTNSKFAEVNELVWQWFKTSRENGVQMSGPMIQEKALQIAQHLQAKDFKGSNGWLHSWRNRYNVTSYKDDTVGTPKLNYINDYSKVEGFNPTMQTCDATNAIMNLGGIGNTVNSSTALNEDGSVPLTNYQDSSDTPHVGNVNIGYKKSDEQLIVSTDQAGICENKNREEIGSVTTKLDNSVNTKQDSLDKEEVNRVAKAYDKIVESALSEYEHLN